MYSLFGGFGQSRILLICFFTAVIVGLPSELSAQLDTNFEGKLTVLKDSPCPPYVFNDVQDYDKPSIDINDLIGRPVILDFFGSHCVSCFKSLPELNRIQKKFSNELKIICVGNLDTTIKRVYNTFKDRYKLNLTVAYDSSIFRLWQIYINPYEVWIDKNGIVQAVTDNSWVTDANVRTFLDNGKIDLPITPNYQQDFQRPFQFDYTKPYLIGGNGGVDSNYIFRSLLGKWSRDQGFVFAENMLHQFGNRYQGLGMTLGAMYQLAYADTITYFYPRMLDEPRSSPNHFGKMVKKPLLLIKDKTPFEADYLSEDKRWDYSLILPKNRSGAKVLQCAMQRDLQTYFGYSVKVKPMKAAYWKLTATASARKKLPNKGAKRAWSCDISNLKMVNMPMELLVNIITTGIPWELVIDETGIHNNIDIEVHAIQTDFGELRKALAKQGLFLIRSYKKINTVVISDPKNH